MVPPLSGNGNYINEYVNLQPRIINRGGKEVEKGGEHGKATEDRHGGVGGGFSPCPGRMGAWATSDVSFRPTAGFSFYPASAVHSADVLSFRSTIDVPIHPANHHCQSN